MSKFGTSHDVYGADGGLLKFVEETAEVCTTCEDSANGPANFGIVREGQGSATLICPNCGEVKNVFSQQVLRKPKEDKPAT